MGALLGKRTLDPPVFGGLQIQTAVNALPIPIVYGSPRIAPNIIYVNGFKATRAPTGGKGLLGGGKSGNQRYNATILLGLCEGPVTQIIFVYQDNGIFVLSSLPPGAVLNLFTGAPGQTPWSYIISNFPADALSYPATSYLGGSNYPLTSSATIPQFSVVPTGPLTGTSPLNPINLSAFGLTVGTAFAGGVYFADADPALCIFDLLTNPTLGIGFPQSLIELDTLFTTASGVLPNVGDNALATYCQAVGLAFSVALIASEQCSSIVTRWLDLLGVTAVWNGIALKFIPYWDLYESGNPGYNAAIGIPLKYYQPTVTPLLDLGDDDFLSVDNEDPLTLERIDVLDILNSVKVDFRDRNIGYNDNIAEMKDEALIETYGIRADSLTGSGEFTYVGYAQQAAAIRLARNVAIRNKYTFRLSLRYCYLDPMDIVTITDSNLGLNKVAVRILTVEENEKFELTITVEEFTAGGLSPTARPGSGGSGSAALNTAVLPPSVFTPVFMQSPSGYNSNFNLQPNIKIGASGGTGGVLGANWGGCEVYVSTDGITYELQDEIVGPTRIGLTTATLAAYGGVNPDTTSTLTIDFSESGASIQSGADADAIAGRTLLWVGSELIGYTGATLVAPNKYTFTRLWRHMYGTTGASLSSGAQAMRIDGAEATINLPSGYSGITLHVKLASFNSFNSMLQSLASCIDYTYTVL